MSDDMTQRDTIFDTSPDLQEIVELDLAQVRPILTSRANFSTKRILTSWQHPFVLMGSWCLFWCVPTRRASAAISLSVASDASAPLSAWGLGVSRHH